MSGSPDEADESCAHSKEKYAATVSHPILFYRIPNTVIMPPALSTGNLLVNGRVTASLTIGRSKKGPLVRSLLS